MIPKKGDTAAEDNPKMSSDFRGLLHMDYQDALSSCYANKTQCLGLNSTRSMAKNKTV